MPKKDVASKLYEDSDEETLIEAKSLHATLKKDEIKDEDFDLPDIDETEFNKKLQEDPFTSSFQNNTKPKEEEVIVVSNKKPKAVEVKSAAPAKVVPQKIGAKKKLNKADFMFKDRKGEVLIKKPGDINGIDFMIRDLEDCTVVLLDHIA